MENVSKAAEVLFLTQPSVSSRIHSLEKEMGEPLFIRSGKKMILSEAGKTFLPSAIKILSEWNNSKVAIQQLRNKIKGELTIGMTIHAVSTFVPHVITFQKKYPDIKLKIKTGHTSEIGDLVLNYIAHIGITRSLDHKYLFSKPVIMDHFTLVVYPEHPLALRNNVNVEDLINEKLILLYSDNSLKERVNTFLHTIKPNIILETDSIEITKRMVIEKQGIAYIPRFSIREEVEEGLLVAVPFNSTYLSLNLDVIWHKEQSNNYLVSLFVDHIFSQLEPV